MKISEIFKDIFSDVNTSNQRNEEARRERGDYWRTPSDRTVNYFGGWITILLPQFLGFVLGLAVTKLLGFGGTAYFVIGGIGALVVGIYKSVSFDKISLVPAIVRNIILMLLFCGAFALLMFFGSSSDSR